MAIDPVCGMTVDEPNPGAHAEYKGQTYYFCSPSCKTTFQRHPEKYVNRPAAKAQDVRRA